MDPIFTLRARRNRMNSVAELCVCCSALVTSVTLCTRRSLTPFTNDLVTGGKDGQLLRCTMRPLFYQKLLN